MFLILVCAYFDILMKDVVLANIFQVLANKSANTVFFYISRVGSRVP